MRVDAAKILLHDSHLCHIVGIYSPCKKVFNQTLHILVSFLRQKCAIYAWYILNSLAQDIPSNDSKNELYIDLCSLSWSE